MNTADIGYVDLIFGFMLLVIPFTLFYFYKIPFIKEVTISLLRMAVQLLLVASYLEWIFKINNAWINSLWVLVMISVGVLTTIKRVQLNWRFFILPLFLSGLATVIIIDAFFLGFIMKLDYVFDARYFIPVTGLILGNALGKNIFALNTYFNSLTEKSELYLFLLTNTGNKNSAINPFLIEAVKQSLSPMIASISVMGLISLPGMMTGQILGGSSPSVAIKYQIMIMVAVFIGSTINIFLSIILSNRFIFDDYGRLRKDVLKKNRKAKKKRK